MAEEFDLVSLLLSILMWGGIAFAVLFVLTILIKLWTDSLIENAANNLVATIAGGIATILLGGTAGRIVSFLVGNLFSWGSFRDSVGHWSEKRKEWKAKRAERKAARKKARAEWWQRQKERFTFKRPSMPKVSMPKVSMPKIGRPTMPRIGNPLNLLKRKGDAAKPAEEVEAAQPVIDEADTATTDAEAPVAAATAEDDAATEPLATDDQAADVQANAATPVEDQPADEAPAEEGKSRWSGITGTVSTIKNGATGWWPSRKKKKA